MTMKHNSGKGAIYAIGIIGALFYFMQQATSFSTVVTGFVKAIFWPAVAVYEAFKLLQL